MDRFQSLHFFTLFVILTICWGSLETDEAKRIVGGQQAAQGRYPYQVAMLNTVGQTCGGTLIRPEWVLTAAHCSSITHVQIGRRDFLNKSEVVEEIEIDFYVNHPNYVSSDYDRDVALYKLKQPSNYSTISLYDNTTEVEAGTNVTVIGWGRTNENSLFGNNALLEAEIDTYNHTLCKIQYQNEYEITENMICASREGKDSCQGDSGGPLIIKGENATSDVQIGIVSFGTGCAREEFPGVYASVSRAASFIDETLNCTTLPPDNCCERAECKSGVFNCLKVSEQCNGIESPSNSLICGFIQRPVDGFDYSKCFASPRCYIGDGYCDGGFYNTPECNYDGGDCCEDTCTNGNSNNCDSSPFDCLVRDENETGSLLCTIFERIKNFILSLIPF